MTCAECDKSLVKWQKRYCSRSCAARAAGRRRCGSKNNRYNGGLCVRSDGRCVIVCRDGSQMLYYRAVMAARVGRLLVPGEIVHHVNGDPTDDRLENLQLVTRAEHVHLHRDDIMDGRGLAA